MSGLLEIINSVSPVFLVIGLGFLLRVRGIISEGVNSSLSKLVFYAAGPAILFRSAANAKVSEVLDVRTWAVVAAVSTAAAFAVYLISARSAPARRGVIAQGVYRSNMVFVGLPVIANAFGDAVLGPAAVFIGLMVPVYNFLAVLVLTLPHHDGGSGKGVWARTAKEVALNPLIIGSASGIAFSALGLTLPVSADRTLELVARLAMPLALLSVGAGLDLNRLRVELVLSSVVSLIKLVIYPAVVYTALRLLVGRSGMALEFPVLIVASPTATVSYIMAREMKGDEQLASSVVIGTTLASLVTISLWLVFFRFMG